MEKYDNEMRERFPIVYEIYSNGEECKMCPRNYFRGSGYFGGMESRDCGVMDYNGKEEDCPVYLKYLDIKIMNEVEKKIHDLAMHIIALYHRDEIIDLIDEIETELTPIDPDFLVELKKFIDGRVKLNNWLEGDGN